MHRRHAGNLGINGAGVLSQLQHKLGSTQVVWITLPSPEFPVPYTVHHHRAPGVCEEVGGGALQ